jgi:hypothetical protein
MKDAQKKKVLFSPPLNSSIRESYTQRTKKMNPRVSEVTNKVAIETLSLGTHERAGESSPVLGTPTEVMQHIGELTVWPEYPRNIILAGGLSTWNRIRTVERIEIGEEGVILNSQFLLPELPFLIREYSAVTLGTDESKGLLIGGLFQMVENNEWDLQKGIELELSKNWNKHKTIEFELSTKNWDINQPMTKHERWFSSSSILPDGSPAICGGCEMSPKKSTEIRGEDGEWHLSETAILHLGRCRHGTTVVNGSMFAIGGYSRNGITNTVEIWDPRNKSGWNHSAIPSMICERWIHSVSSLDDSIFVFGGTSGNRRSLSSCESFDIRSNKWKSISSMPVERGSHSSIIIGDQILLVGGFPDTTQIDSYDAVTNTWTTLQHNILQSRFAFQAFTL